MMLNQKPGKDMTHDEIRQVVLEVLKDVAASRERSISIHGLIDRLQNRIDCRYNHVQTAVLEIWSELFRTGYLAWGLNFANPEAPWAHVTEHGTRSLERVSRDPSNPAGYMAALGSACPAGTVAASYLREALATYNTGCYKAAAVMIGAAGEALVLDLRDDLMNRLGTLGKPVPKDLSQWQVKSVCDAVEAQISLRSKAMPKDLRERFDGYWSSFTSHLRLSRNDAGHPKSVDPVTVDVVHGSLLIFPELAKLVADLRTWVASAAFT